MCALSNCDIADDIELPQAPQTIISQFVHFAPFLFVLSVVRNFKFGLPVNGSKSQPNDDKSSLKWAWLWSRDTLKILDPLKYICNGYS